jgi:hypothetical protein
MRLLRPWHFAERWEPTAEFGSVGWLVPRADRYTAFTRLFHPIQSSDPAGPTRWQDLAARTGRTWHPQVQFNSINIGGSAQRYSATLADLGSARLSRLVPQLDSPDTSCVIALSEINHWASYDAAFRRDTVESGVDQATWDAAAVLTSPLRTHRLFLGVLEDLPQFGTRSGMFVQQQPTLLWDQEFTFCLATDPDYDSTILASSVAIQQRVLACPDLECLPVEPESSLLWDADGLNGAPPMDEPR